MPEFYPRDHEGRINFWERRIKYALDGVEDAMKVGDTLDLMFNNEATTDREKMKEAERFSEEGRTKVGKVYAWIEQSIANMLDRDPLFRVSARNRYSAPYVRHVDSAINYYYRETQQLFHDQRIMRDAFIFPYGVKKIGWNSRIEEKDTLDLTDLATFSEEDPLAAANLLAGGIPLQVLESHDHEEHIEAAVRVSQDATVRPEIVKAVIDPYIEAHKMMLERPTPDKDTTIQFDQPYGVRWRPRDFVTARSADNGILDAEFVAFRWRRTLADVKMNPAYKNTSSLESQSEHRPYGAPEYLEELGFDDFATVEGWEIWARDFPVSRTRRANLLITLVPGHEKLLQHEEEWPFTRIEDYPVETLQFQTATNTWFNKPALALAGADNIQKLVNEFLDSMLSAMRKDKNLYLADKELFEDDEELENIENLPEGGIHLVEGLADKRGQAVQAWPHAQITGDKVGFFNILNHSFDEAAGTPQPQRSLQPDTATEATIIERRASAREQARANAVARLQINTARKFYQLETQFLPKKALLIDPLALEEAAVDETVAKGEYQFTIDVSSKATSQAVEFDRWNKFLNLATGVLPTFLQVGLPMINLAEIVRELIRRGLDITDVERFMPAGTEQDQRVMEAMKDPVQRQAIVESLARLRGGGEMVGGTGPGPINPQGFAAQPRTEADELTRANQ